ncbi:MAG: matrixin family metalloprotease [Deltaproteobacteria bacterium]|nr:matrixin family metalloprotease [Deltaproteobacteria bacterium]
MSRGRKRLWPGLILALVALGLLGPLPPSIAAPAARTIYVQPLGKALPAADVALVKHALEVFTGLPVKVLARVPLPRAAWYPPRRRWRAEKLLTFLGRRMPADGFRILGLTAADISTTKGRYKDWGVLGLANLAGTACVISSLRCHRRSRGGTQPRIRLAKVAVHEIGHTLGLEHCPTLGCLMEDARGKVKTCDREYDLCPRCRRKLARRGYHLPATPKIPWPRPRSR